MVNTGFRQRGDGYEIIYAEQLYCVCQRLIINRMLEDDFKGHMNTSKYAKLAKCSNDTALRDIQDLKDRGIFIQNRRRRKEHQLQIA
jgi:Fic family protein